MVDRSEVEKDRPVRGIGRRAKPLGLGLPLGFGTRDVRVLQSETVKAVSQGLRSQLEENPKDRTVDQK